MGEAESNSRGVRTLFWSPGTFFLRVDLGHLYLDLCHDDCLIKLVRPSCANNGTTRVEITPPSHMSLGFEVVFLLLDKYVFKPRTHLCIKYRIRHILELEDLDQKLHLIDKKYTLHFHICDS